MAMVCNLARTFTLTWIMEHDGSDAMHPDPDYSAAYVVLRTDRAVDGHGFTFTIGRGNELCVAAIQAHQGCDTAELRVRFTKP